MNSTATMPSSGGGSDFEGVGRRAPQLFFHPGVVVLSGGGSGRMQWEGRRVVCGNLRGHCACVQKRSRGRVAAACQTTIQPGRHTCGPLRHPLQHTTLRKLVHLGVPLVTAYPSAPLAEHDSACRQATATGAEPFQAWAPVSPGSCIRWLRAKQKRALRSERYTAIAGAIASATAAEARKDPSGGSGCLVRSQGARADSDPAGASTPLTSRCCLMEICKCRRRRQQRPRND